MLLVYHTRPVNTEFCHFAEADPTHMGGGKRSRGTLLGIFNFLKRKRDDMLPQFTSKIPSTYLSSKERIL